MDTVIVMISIARRTLVSPLERIKLKEPLRKKIFFTYLKVNEKMAVEAKEIMAKR